MNAMRMSRTSGVPLALSIAVLVTACAKTSAQPARSPVAADTVASVGTTAVTLAQVDEKAMQMAASTFGGLKLSQALYEARRAAIDDIVETLLISQDARSRGMDEAAVVAKEITDKVPRPTDAEVSAWYTTNQAKLQGAPLEQVREPIVTYLTRERTNAARETYVTRLRAKAAIRVTLEPPREVIASAGHPSKGPAGAPIQLVEFSDFQCPYCLRANPTVQQVLSTYGDRIHFVYRHYPLQNHPRARPSAEAAACADEQGKFWLFHDVLFADSTKLADTDLKAHAAKVGLDVARFTACVDSHKYAAAVEQDIKEGNEVGVSATPTFFVNGRLLSGAQPFDVFKRVIDEELALAKR